MTNRIFPLFALLCAFVTASACLGKTITIEVSSEGSSLYAAQLEASRLALQQALPQLVTSNREVINDKLRESILSSSTGFIQNIEIIKTSQSQGRTLLDARVTVSEEVISQFNYLKSNSSSASISGASMLAEAEREKQDFLFKDEFLKNALSGFPNSAIEFVITKVSPGAGDTVRLSLSGQIKSEFIDSLVSSIKAIGCDRNPLDTLECAGVVRVKRKKSGDKEFFLGSLKKVVHYRLFYALNGMPPAIAVFPFKSSRPESSIDSVPTFTPTLRITFFDENGSPINGENSSLVVRVAVPAFKADRGNLFYIDAGTLIVDDRPFHFQVQFNPIVEFGKNFAKASKIEVDAYVANCPDLASLLDKVTVEGGFNQYGRLGKQDIERTRIKASNCSDQKFPKHRDLISIWSSF
jgi:hypothetical protein